MRLTHGQSRRGAARGAVLAISCALAITPTVAQDMPAPTGDLHQQHLFAGETEPAYYRLFVPTNYDPAKSYPLVVALHGSGSDENSPFDRSGLVAIAQQKGYILLAPFGSRRGGFGNCFPVVVTKETAASLPSPDKPTTPRAPRAMAPLNDKPVAADDFVYQSATELQPDFKVAAHSEAETMNVIALVRSQITLTRRAST